MDPFLEKNPIFHELHTQVLAGIQAQLQTQIRPKYVARLERYLSEGSVWGLEVESLDGKEPDVAIVEGRDGVETISPMATLAQPTVSATEELDPEELELRKQRRIVIYVNERPRLAVTSIELLSPSNKQAGSLSRDRYLEKRSSALHGGLHWVEIDLLRGGSRPPMSVVVPENTDYLVYVAQATLTGWNHGLFAWDLRDALPTIPIPLLSDDHAAVNLAAAFQEAYDRIAGDDEADYQSDPPPPALPSNAAEWTEQLLREHGYRK